MHFKLRVPFFYKMIFTGQKWAKKTTESSEQVDDTCGIAEFLGANQVNQVHCSERVHTSFRDNLSIK
jgi:hypothetical protein